MREASEVKRGIPLGAVGIWIAGIGIALLLISWLFSDSLTAGLMRIGAVVVTLGVVVFGTKGLIRQLIELERRAKSLSPQESTLRARLKRTLRRQ